MCVLYFGSHAITIAISYQSWHMSSMPFEGFNFEIPMIHSRHLQNSI